MTVPALDLNLNENSGSLGNFAPNIESQEDKFDQTKPNLKISSKDENDVQELTRKRMVDILTGKNLERNKAKEMMPWELAHQHDSMSPEESARCRE